MEIYNPRDPEHLDLLHTWYKNLRDAPDFRRCFHQNVRTNPTFVKHFDGENGLIFSRLDGKLVTCIWVKPFFDGMEMGLWIDKNHRGREAIEEVCGTLSTLLSRVPFIIAYSIQPLIQRLMKLYGFKVVGKIPNAWEGKDLPMFQVTKESFRAFIL